MEIQTSSTFKQFLQAETLNANKNKSYYQGYDVKRPRAFHKQAMIKQQIYDNMIARQSGMIVMSIMSDIQQYRDIQR